MEDKFLTARRWVNKNVDLTKLADVIRSFVKLQGLRTENEEFTERSRIFRVTELVEDNLGRLRRRSRNTQISIDGCPNDFVITLDRGNMNDGLASPKIIGRLLSFFGGGYLVMKRLRAQEAFNIWQERFWSFIQEQIADLVNSAKANLD
jgi:hypothetical protein